MTARQPARPGTPCPCGSGHSLQACCGAVHAGAPADTAEALMRARYSAYVLGHERFLLDSWHPETRPAALDLGAPPCPQWIRLRVIEHRPVDAAHATVSFVATYRLNGRACTLREISRFQRIDGRWTYVDGDVSD